MAVVLAVVAGASATGSENAPAERRPRIGLALGGGGARGGSHVGVLKVLERLHVPVDYIAGTSMGAVVGGLYAAGVPPERIEAEMRALDWSEILADRTPYHDLVWRRKEDEGLYLLDLDLGLRGGKLRVPTGLRAGQKLGFELQALTLPVAGVENFSELPIPFSAVATDIETGERVTLDHGRLWEAILASMTIPGVFAPVEMDGRLLVDGGMADNLPVEVVRSMGADIVIAVDVGTPLASREAIKSFLGVTGQAFTFLTRKNSERSAALADLVIRPGLAGISTGDFHSIGDAIARGEAAAAGLQERLARLATSDEVWRARDAARRTPPAPSGPCSAVTVEGNRRVDRRIVLARARIHTGETLEVPVLRSAVRRVYGLDLFQTVRFDLRREDDGTGLVLRVAEKPWGPTYLHFGIDLVDDLAGGATYGVKANVTRTSLNALGAEWRTDLQLGSRPSLKMEFFQPIDFSGRLFVAPWGRIDRRLQPIFIDGAKIAFYQVRVQHLQLDAGVEYGRFGELRVGLYRNRVRAEVDTGQADLPRFDVAGGGIAFTAELNTLDRPAIPHRGSELNVRGTFSRSRFGADDSYDRVEAGVVQFLGRGRHTIFGVAELGTNLGSRIPIYDEFLVGGLFSFGGYSDGELRGQLYGSVKGGYHYRLAALPSGLGQGIYLGLIVETGNVWASTREVSWSGLRYGGTIIAGADTLVGPIFIAYGRAEGGRGRIYLTVGRAL